MEGEHLKAYDPLTVQHSHRIPDDEAQAKLHEARVRFVIEDGQVKE